MSAHHRNNIYLLFLCWPTTISVLFNSIACIHVSKYPVVKFTPESTQFSFCIPYHLHRFYYHPREQHQLDMHRNDYHQTLTNTDDCIHHYQQHMYFSLQIKQNTPYCTMYVQQTFTSKFSYSKVEVIFQIRAFLRILQWRGQL